MYLYYLACFYVRAQMLFAIASITISFAIFLRLSLIFFIVIMIIIIIIITTIIIITDNISHYRWYFL